MSKTTTSSLLAGLLVLALVAGAAIGQDQQPPDGEPNALPGGLLFEDDFASGDLSKHNDAFRWGRSGRIIEPTGASDRIVTVDGPNGEPVHAMRFHYRGEDNPQGPSRWEEVRFHLTQSADEKRTETSESNVAHREVWVRYTMKIPANYQHLKQDGPVNQKGWLFLWNRNYKTEDGPDGRPAPMFISSAWWPASGDHAGQSVADWVTRKGGGHGGATWVREDHQVPGSSKGLTWLKSDQGTWVDFAFRTRASSGPDAKDALIQVYRNGELVQERADFVAYPKHEEDYHLAGFDRGYILGYHNAIYPEDTTFYITDFKIGTTGESVGVTPARP